MIMKGRNTNHPKKGASIKVQPIRGLDAISSIKRNLSRHPRNLCLFTPVSYTHLTLPTNA